TTPCGSWLMRNSVPSYPTSTRPKSDGLARPVRMAARSRRAACTACFIFSSASCKRARTCSSMALTLASDFRPDPLAQACLNDVFRLVEVKDDGEDLVVHAQRCGRGVHDAQAAVEHFNIGDEN